MTFFEESAMKRFVVCTILLAALPMALLNPESRDAFMGYYLGVIATWFVFLASGWFRSAGHLPAD
jgi:hypothetical protein